MSDAGRSLLRVLRLLFKAASYLALVIGAFGIAALAVATGSGLCPRFDEGAVQCLSPAVETLGGIGLFVVLVFAFTVVPAILALAGLIFLVVDIAALVRRIRSRAARGAGRPFDIEA